MQKFSNIRVLNHLKRLILIYYEICYSKNRKSPELKESNLLIIYYLIKLNYSKVMKINKPSGFFVLGV